MAKANKWWRATLRGPLLKLPAGHAVLVIRSKISYTSIGPTWWVMSCSSSVVYQVAESYGGPELRQLLVYEREAFSQHLIVEKANRLLVNYKVANYKVANYKVANYKVANYKVANYKSPSKGKS